MLYIYYSDNPSLSADKARSLVKSLIEKRPDSTLVKVEDNTFSKDILEANIGGQGLFSAKYIIYLDRVIRNKENENLISEYLEPMAQSENIFIVSEGNLTADILKKMKDFANKIVCVEDKNAKTKKTNNEIFSLTDYFGEKKNIKAWEIYRRLIDRGTEVENIIGTLFWQMKSMYIAGEKSSPEESGLNPFVYSKSKKFLAHWSRSDILEKLNVLTTLYHESHRGNCNLEQKIEILILKNSKDEEKYS